MRYSAAALSRGRTVIVTLFVAFGVLFFGLLWAKSGGSIPLVTGHGYKVNAEFSNIGNLAHASDVQMAGVPIGTVANLDVGNKGSVKVDMILHRNAPLHEGATVGIQTKTLIGEAYILVTDGHGKALPSGTTLPLSAQTNYTSLNDVFNAIKPAQQTAAKQLLTEFNSSTTGQGQNIQQILSGLATVGSRGQTVFDVLAGQTNDLQTLVRETGTLMGVLNEGQGQIGDLASTAEQVSQATANSQAALSSTVEKLPGVIQQAQSSSGSIEQLSSALQPVATNLQAAAPTLNQALITLPSTTNSLRTLVTPLNTALDRAPATLNGLPQADNTLSNLLPSTANVLSNLDPIVGYLAPYNRDIGSFFSNFNAAAATHRDANSFYAQVPLIFTQGSGGLPLPANLEGLLNSAAFNPIPAPGQGQTAAASPKSNPVPPAQLTYSGSTHS